MTDRESDTEHMPTSEGHVTMTGSRAIVSQKEMTTRVDREKELTTRTREAKRVETIEEGLDHREWEEGTIRRNTRSLDHQVDCQAGRQVRFIQVQVQRTEQLYLCISEFTLSDPYNYLILKIGNICN